MKSFQKICVIRTDRIGDMILTLPMCKALKENCPGSQINLIAKRYVEPLVENDLFTDKVLYIDDYEGGIKDILGNNKFDAAFFPRPRFNECLSAFINKIPLRVGTAYRYYSMLFNHKVYDHRKTAEFHEAEYNTRLVESVFGINIKTELVKPYINPDSYKYANDIMIRNGVCNKNYIIIHPGSGGSAYNWKPENFGKAGKKLHEITGLNIIITGIQKEYGICEIVKQQIKNSVNLCGQFDLRQMISLISDAKLLIANSTGVLHIASALGIPVLGLYPNSAHLSAKRWGPYSMNSKVVSPPKSDNKQSNDNMELIPIEDVVNNALELLNSH
ncbi:MAG: glycosyltransferase family 9 protein [Ignavibacteriae bacterium]|nr:glycosyltransferase family 9 protein [Ignavibacteriota bacterium]